LYFASHAAAIPRRKSTFSCPKTARDSAISAPVKKTEMNDVTRQHCTDNECVIRDDCFDCLAPVEALDTNQCTERWTE
jgi:hypothetical protein